MKLIGRQSQITPFIASVILLAGNVVAQQSSIKLKSGKEFKVLQVGPVYGQGMKKLGVELQYETELRVSNVTILRKEADQVWDAFRPQVEKANEKAAIVSAVEKRPSGIIKKSQGYNFVFERRPDGTWHCLDDK
jgi:hypothetical protein